MAIRPETKVWWGQAQRDFAIARLTHGERAYDAAVFFCEQASQKALKALILHRTAKMPPRIHNLPELGRLVGVPAKLSRFLAELQPHYIRTRYPDAAGAVTNKIYDGRLSLHFQRGTEKVLDWVRSRLR
ncbi:MAG: HEPN domain-containing protein [Methanobacteriota archaeon]|nr:MAG: HEPN domain-containing protein [Euryarchaeota archaeon]